MIPPTNGNGDSEMQVLLASLHRDRSLLEHSGIERLTTAQWEGLLRLAEYQRVRPLLHQRLHETGQWLCAPEPVWRQLTDTCRRIAMRQVRLQMELSQILAALAAVNIPAIVLKGAYLGPIVYKNVGSREMNDLDIMVPRSQLEEALGALRDLGYEKLFPFSVAETAAICHDLAPLTKPGAAAVEIHWNITSPNLPTSIDAEALWTHAVDAHLAAGPALCLSPIDQILHLCAHASFQHQFEFGLRPACDLQQVIRHYGEQIDWDQLADTARQRNWLRGVALAISLANDLVGTSLTADVIDKLGPTDELKSIARDITLAGPDDPGSFYIALTDLGAKSWRTKLLAIRSQIFIPKPVLLACYQTSSDASWWRWLYVRRIFDLLKNYSRISVRLLLGIDAQAQALARRRMRMRAWLNGES